MWVLYWALGLMAESHPEPAKVSIRQPFLLAEPSGNWRDSLEHLATNGFLEVEVKGGMVVMKPGHLTVRLRRELAAVLGEVTQVSEMTEEAVGQEARGG